VNAWIIAVPIVIALGLVARAFARHRRGDHLRIPHHKIDVSYRTGQFRR
jgi:hypothetical protein